MPISLQGSARKAVLIAATLLIVSAYAIAAATEFLASYFAQYPDPTNLQRAVWLQPGNATYQHLLGRYFALVHQSPDQAEHAYRAAVTLNPRSARYWLDLAALYQTAGQDDKERAALRQSLIAEPTNPEVAWEAGNLYLVLGNEDMALQQFKTALAHDAYLPPLALQFCWRVKPDVDKLLRDVIPALPGVYSSFLDLLVSKKETAAAAKVWTKLIELRQPVEKRHIVEYVRLLVAEREPDQALRVWQQSATIAGLEAYQPSQQNLLVNGDFSLDLLNGGFDWLYQKRRDVDLTLDPIHFRTGRRSLLIEFDSHGLADAGIRHLVAVQPNTTYDFSANFKTDGLEGVGGPKFVVQDLYSQRTYFASDELTDVESWSEVSGQFTTGDDTKLLVVRVAREPTGLSIKGKLWIDGLRLMQPSSARTAASEIRF